MLKARVGLVTVTYNSSQVLEGFFDSLWNQEYNNFICVAVDNQSQDDSYQKLTLQNDPRLIVINNEKNLGVAEGNNQGIRYCLENGCDYIILINNDTEFQPNLIDQLVINSTESKQKIVVPKMYYYDRKNTIWCAGGYFIKWAAWANRHYGENEVDHGQFDRPSLIQYCPTCCMLIHREVFIKVGLMDPEYFVYFDDVDFCIRALRKNISILYTPSASLWHKVSSLTGGAESDFTIYYGSRNKALMIEKNFSGLTAYIYHIFSYSKFVLRYITGKDSYSVMKKKITTYSNTLFSV